MSIIGSQLYFHPRDDCFFIAVPDYILDHIVYRLKASRGWSCEVSQLAYGDGHPFAFFFPAAAHEKHCHKHRDQQQHRYVLPIRLMSYLPSAPKRGASFLLFLSGIIQ